MPRKMVIQLKDGSTPILAESDADDELQLQEMINRHPEVIPIEEFGMTGSMMVIGRETYLPSGAVDLIGLTRQGNILIVEFKTGPQNSDFRHALEKIPVLTSWKPGTIPNGTEWTCSIGQMEYLAKSIRKGHGCFDFELYKGHIGKSKRIVNTETGSCEKKSAHERRVKNLLTKILTKGK